jgi:hypothetical protein
MRSASFRTDHERTGGEEMSTTSSELRVPSALQSRVREILAITDGFCSERG